MTHEQKILARAMNHLDDDMILAAHGPRKKLRRAIIPAVVLCFLAAFLAVFPYLREVIDTGGPPDGGVIEENDGTKPEAYPFIPMNRPTALGRTTLTLTAVTDTTAAFTVVKTDDSPIYALLRDRLDGALASTEAGYKDNGVVIRPNTIRIYTDGAEQPAYTIPSAPGTYRVLVDFDTIRNGRYPMQEYVEIYAYVGEDGAPVALRFSLETEEDTGTETETETETEPEADSAADS